MSQEQGTTWVTGIVTLLVAVWYVSTVGSMLGLAPVDDLAYHRPLLIAVGAMIVLNIVGSVALAIGKAIRAEVRTRGSTHGIDRMDERDVRIGAHGDRAGYYVVAATMVGVLAMAMLEQPYSWIANGAFLALVAATLVSAAVKLVAYRRGL